MILGRAKSADRIEFKCQILNLKGMPNAQMSNILTYHLIFEISPLFEL